MYALQGFPIETGDVPLIAVLNTSASFFLCRLDEGEKIKVEIASLRGNAAQPGTNRPAVLRNLDLELDKIVKN